MKLLILLFAWCALLVVCWPLALLAAVLAPFVWLLSIPLRLIASVVHGVLALIATLALLPARLLGYRSRA